MSDPQLLLGDEAVALGAMHGGISTAYGYPGTPSTEILEFILPKAADSGIHSCWATNEKVALEMALGTAVTGRRSIATMKHVGLNVAMDPFMSSALAGVTGGLLVCVADDPGMHSSQNEQDTRGLASFALLPCLEPCDQQEAYEMARDGLDLSEQAELPFVFRLVTRLSHSRARVEPTTPRAQNTHGRVLNRACATLLPQNARVQYQKLLDKQTLLQEMSCRSRFNILDLNKSDRRRGYIVSGIAYNYLREAYAGDIPHPFLKIGMYPLPKAHIESMFAAVDEVVILEEGYPIIEQSLRGLLDSTPKPVRGKLDGFLPRTGELSPTIVASAVLEQKIAVATAPRWTGSLPARPPALCAGCPHADAVKALNGAVADHPNRLVVGDIGCYTLSYYPPYSCMDVCFDMGASISMAIGASKAGSHPVISTIGDSTFTHSGITGLITAVKEDANMTVLILDNETTAMTGTQESAAFGEDLLTMIRGSGIAEEHLRVLEPMPRSHEENVRVLKEEIGHQGISVIVFRRRCIQKR